MLGRWMGASIANRIAVATLLLTTLFVLLIGVLSYGFASNLIQDDAQKNLNGQAEIAAQRLEVALNSATRSIASLAGNALIINALAKSHATDLQPFLRDHVLSLPAPFDLSLADFQGRTLANNHGRMNVAYGILPWFGRVMQKGERYAEIRLVAGNPTLMLANPVSAAAGMPGGVLVMQWPMQKLLADRMSYFKDGQVDRIILSQSGSREIAILGKPLLENVVEVAMPLALVSPLDTLQLGVRLQVPRDKAFAPLRSLAVAYVVIGVITLVIALWLTRVVARRLTQPLSRLGALADEVSRENRFDLTFPESGEDEVGALTTAFGRMLESVRVSHELLEQLIAQRTHELIGTQTRMQAVLDNVMDGIVTIDTAGQIEIFNRSAEKLFGYQAEEVIGHNVNMLMPEPYRSAHDGHMRDYLKTGKAKIIGIGREVVCLRKDGSIFPAELSISEMYHGERRTFVGMVHDITERQKIDRMKSEFVSTVSHELRTPLTSIHGSLGLLAGGMGGAMPERMMSLIEIGYKNSERLISLINDILDMEKIATGKMHFDMEPQEVMPILENAIEANQAYGSKYRVRFVLTTKLPGAYIRVDSSRMNQILSNLLSNAAKFSPPGSQVELGAVRLDGNIRIFVSDHGSGIPGVFRDKIFQKFSQADASDSRLKGGTGLGLSISRSLTEGMGGRIGYEPQDGPGTVFFVEFPETVEPI
jgi:PAS domain S-box-containing protein